MAKLIDIIWMYSVFPENGSLAYLPVYSVIDRQCLLRTVYTEGTVFMKPVVVHIYWAIERYTFRCARPN